MKGLQALGQVRDVCGKREGLVSRPHERLRNHPSLGLEAPSRGGEILELERTGTARKSFLLRPGTVSRASVAQTEAQPVLVSRFTLCTV